MLRQSSARWHLLSVCWYVLVHGAVVVFVDLRPCKLRQCLLLSTCFICLETFQRLFCCSVSMFSCMQRGGCGQSSTCPMA